MRWPRRRPGRRRPARARLRQTSAPRPPIVGRLLWRPSRRSPRPRLREPARAVLTATAAVALLAAVIVPTSTVMITDARDEAATPSATPAPGLMTPAAPEDDDAPTPSPGAIDLNTRSIDDPASIWVVVNKVRPLQPVDWAPGDLVTVDVTSNPGGDQMRAEAAEALHRMDQAARDESGQGITIVSGYRSYERQQSLYAAYARRDGQAAADTYSSRPGHSEHQTGLSCDLQQPDASCSVCNQFGSSPLGEWLAGNAWRFGFVQRYEAGQEHVTGFMEETWHYRYVGVDLATWMHEHDVHTLEAAFSLPDAPDYP